MNRRQFTSWIAALSCLCLSWPAQAKPTRAVDPQAFREFSDYLAATDVVFLDGAVVVEKRGGYRVKINSSELQPVPGKKDTFASVCRVGGVNESKRTLKLATFIPLFAFREHPAPATQVVSVKVNGVESPAIVFSGPLNQKAIDVLKKTFPGNHLLDTQIEARTPNLFIPLSTLGPSQEIVVEYRLAPRSGQRVH